MKSTYTLSHFTRFTFTSISIVGLIGCGAAENANTPNRTINPVNPNSNIPDGNNNNNGNSNGENVDLAGNVYIPIGQSRVVGLPQDYTGFCNATNLATWEIQSTANHITVSALNSCAPTIGLLTGFTNPNEQVMVIATLPLGNNRSLRYGIKPIARMAPVLTLPRIVASNQPAVLNLSLIDNDTGRPGTNQYSNGVSGLTLRNGMNYSSQWVDLEVVRIWDALTGTHPAWYHGDANSINTNRPFTFPAPTASDPQNRGTAITISLRCDLTINQFYGGSPLNPPQNGYQEPNNGSRCPLENLALDSNSQTISFAFKGNFLDVHPNPLNLGYFTRRFVLSNYFTTSNRFYGSYNIYAKAMTDGVESPEVRIAYIPMENEPN